MENQSEKLVPLLKIITEKLEKKFNKELKANGVTFSQMRVVVLLCSSDKEDYTMKELERIFEVTQQTAAGIINRLEQKKLVVSYPDDEDKRVKRIKPTQAGEKLAAEIRDKMLGIEDWIEDSITQEEYATLLSLLQKSYAYVE